jgi:diketogulonate reductase-like aldo/keto reductase
MYGNQREVGRALRESGGAFVTTKLPPDHAGRERETLQQSLEQLGVDAVDLWLVHWPPGRTAGVGVWERFIEAREQGLVRDIGVSNYSAEQIDELERATGVRPAVNQVPGGPLQHDPEVLRAHEERGVVVEGYSGLRHGVLEHPTVTALAERLGRSPAQVVIRWHLEHGIVVIPKSSSSERIRSNADVDGFQLSPEDVAALDDLGSTA